MELEKIEELYAAGYHIQGLHMNEDGTPYGGEESEWEVIPKSASHIKLAMLSPDQLPSFLAGEEIDLGGNLFRLIRPENSQSPVEA